MRREAAGFAIRGQNALGVQLATSGHDESGGGAPTTIARGLKLIRAHCVNGQG